jgi:hypothetical protein
MRSGGTLKTTLYEIFIAKIAKQIVGTSSGLRRIRDWTLWRGRPLPKRKKKLRAEYEPEMWEHLPLGIVLPPTAGKEKKRMIVMHLD